MLRRRAGLMRPVFCQALAALGLLVWLAACSPPRAIEAARVLADLSAPSGNGQSERDAIAPRRVAFAPGSGLAVADLYWPDQAKAAVVLVPGVVPEGKDDPRLVALAQTLARARFAVLVPDIASLRAQKVSPGDARAIADAITQLAGCVPGRGPSVGVIAISYAAGPAILAALRPDSEDKLRFVVAIGGYYDLQAVVTFFTTGYVRAGPDKPWRHRTPNAYGKWVFVGANAERLDDPGDRAALAAMAARKLRNLDADVSDLKAGLGPEGRSVMALLDNPDPERVPTLIAGLPEAVRRDLEALDLARHDLSRLQARLLLVHGRDDPIIPSTESQALAAAAPEGSTKLYLVDSLAHVELSLTSLVDGFRLWRAVYWLLVERDAAPQPELSACLNASGP